MQILNLKATFLLVALLLSMWRGDCTCSNLDDFVTWAEGKRGCVYKDPGGIKHIGIGFNLQRAGARDTFLKAGLNYDSALNGQYCLTDSEMKSLFNNDIQWARDGARNCVPSFDSQPLWVQNVLIDMTYNMGGTSLWKWPKFVQQIGSRLYESAAKNMASTKYWGQVGNRCTRNQEVLRRCVSYA